MKEGRWERRERKERKRKDFAADNRKSIDLLARLAFSGIKKKWRKKRKHI